MALTKLGSAPKARSPMIGLSGLESTSSTGAKFRLMPTRAELGGDSPAGPMGKIEIVARADGSGGGKMGERPGQAVHFPAFLVDGDKRRQARRVVPEIAAKGQDLARLAAIVAKKNKAAETVFGEDQSFVAAEALAGAADHDHLADFFAQRFHQPAV